MQDGLLKFLLSPSRIRNGPRGFQPYDGAVSVFPVTLGGSILVRCAFVRVVNYVAVTVHGPFRLREDRVPTRLVAGELSTVADHSPVGGAPLPAIPLRRVRGLSPIHISEPTRPY